MKVWKQFDTDCSGYIEADELKQFIKELLTKRRGTQITDEKLIEYADTIVCWTSCRLSVTNVFATSCISSIQMAMVNYNSVKWQSKGYAICSWLMMNKCMSSRLLPVKENFLLRPIFKVNEQYRPTLDGISLVSSGLFVDHVSGSRSRLSTVRQGKIDSAVMRRICLSSRVGWQRNHRRRRIGWFC